MRLLITLRDTQGYHLAKLKSLPPIPSTFYSPLGPLKVTLSDTLASEGDVLGLCRYNERELLIDHNQPPISKWATFWHENFHMFLYDTGLHNQLASEEDEETFCDAFGTYMTGVMLQGYLEVPVENTK